MDQANRILLIDLNNFARYPTLAIGYLASILRRGRFEVEVFSPLSTGISGVVREPRPKPWGFWLDRAKYGSGVSHNQHVRQVRNWLSRTSLNAPSLQREADTVAEGVAQRLTEDRYDAVLVSSYLMYYELCRTLGEMCEGQDIPFLVGGPYFAQPEVRQEWLNIPGLSGLVGGEVEFELCDIVQAVVDRQPLDSFDGVWTDDPSKPNMAPIHDLDAIPFPDFSDFPWDNYPNRIIPMVSGRGCSWGACTFCGDVTGTVGRRYRSRSPNNVLEEMRYQSDRFGTKSFVFTDPKLNSNLNVWNALLGDLPSQVPDASWIGAVHIGATGPNGLSRGELRAARQAGMVRLTTGFESGSQRVLDLMKKGVELEESSDVLESAAAEDISVRVTMIAGYPGERAADVEKTAIFLENHSLAIERVAFNRFHIITGTRFHRSIDVKPELYPDIYSLTPNHRQAIINHESTTADSPEYRRAMIRVLAAVHTINRRPLRPAARSFEGVM